MPRPVPIGLSFRIEGAKDAEGKVQAFPPKVLDKLRKSADRRAQKTVLKFKREMEAEYKSQWATGRIAAGITHKVSTVKGGVDVKFYIPDYRELRYITSMLGGHFQGFPVAPFIITPVTSKYLRIRFPNTLARRFIRGEKGRFLGSAPGGAIFVRQVLWGKKTGGFHRDVLREVAEEESVLFVQDMSRAVAAAAGEITTT